MVLFYENSYVADGFVSQRAIILWSFDIFVSVFVKQAIEQSIQLTRCHIYAPLQKASTFHCDANMCKTYIIFI